MYNVLFIDVFVYIFNTVAIEVNVRSPIECQRFAEVPQKILYFAVF